MDEKGDLKIDQAHCLNRLYMREASKTLLSVRRGLWKYQYFLLFFCIILSYPTPVLITLKKNVFSSTDERSGINAVIFWLFWGGIFEDPAKTGNWKTHIPEFLIMTLLLFERLSQAWQQNRLGVNAEMISKYKTLEEKLAKIKQGLPPTPMQEECEYQYKHTRTKLDDLSS